MSCTGRWEVTLKRNNGIIDLMHSVQIDDDPAGNNVITVALIGTDGKPIAATRRKGVCLPGPTPQHRYLMLILRGAREWIVNAIVDPPSQLGRAFTGTYFAPDTGDTGTGSGSQTGVRLSDQTNAKAQDAPAWSSEQAAGPDTK